MEELKCLICGMKINPHNYDLNKHSLIEKNEKDRIINCPFCGVEEKHLDSKRDNYSVDLRDLNDISLKILEKAMKIEVFNGGFYQEASKLAKSEQLKKTFKDLSNIEMMHARIHKNLGAFEKLPTLHKPDYTRHDTDELLLEEACKREKHAVSFYKHNMNAVANEQIKEIFQALSDVEQQHAVITDQK